MRLQIISLLIVLSVASSLAQDKMPKNFNYIGQVEARHAKDITASKISVGAEMMDRDFTIYDNWKAYLGKLGAKKARIQSGWAKTEKQAGVYHFAWLDSIVWDMSAQGVEPWINLSYGNPVYAGGGGTTLKQKALPSTEEALVAWERYVALIVARYQDHVDEWEIWNEPNYGIDPEEFARFVVRTAKVIKKIQPEAIVIGMALGSHVDYEFADKVLAEIANQGGIHLIDQVIHHRHIIIPEDNKNEVALERVVDKYSNRIAIRQGEAGCPSQYSEAFALHSMEWDENQQAKHILRRLMCDLGRNKETNIFTIMDARYIRDGKAVWNYKGLLASDENLKVTTVKPAYYAMQHVTAIFDNHLEPIADMMYQSSTSENLYVFGHQDIYSKQHLVALWFGNEKPSPDNNYRNITISLQQANFTDPVYVDLRTGKVWDIPDNSWTPQGTQHIFKNIPVYDSPILIAERELITITKP